MHSSCNFRWNVYLSQQNERKREEAASDSWDVTSDEDCKDVDDVEEVPCAVETSDVINAASEIPETLVKVIERKYFRAAWSLSDA